MKMYAIYSDKTKWISCQSSASEQILVLKFGFLATLIFSLKLWMVYSELVAVTC